MSDNDKQRRNRVWAHLKGKGINLSEVQFNTFMAAADRLNLDPIMGQIFPALHKNKKSNSMQMSVMVQVAGMRAVAERTEKYAPGQATQFTGENGVETATAFVKKQTADGTWHEVAETVWMTEYKGNGPIWTSKPHVMLAKCAEAMALRRAFPELSGVYTTEEMDQARNGQPEPEPEPESAPPEDPRDIPGPKALPDSLPDYAPPPAHTASEPDPPPKPEVPDDVDQADELVKSCKKLWEKYQPKLEKFAESQGTTAKREFWAVAKGLNLEYPRSANARWDFSFVKWGWEGFELMVRALSDSLGNVRGM